MKDHTEDRCETSQKEKPSKNKKQTLTKMHTVPVNIISQIKCRPSNIKQKIYAAQDKAKKAQNSSSKKPPQLVVEKRTKPKISKQSSEANTALYKVTRDVHQKELKCTHCGKMFVGPRALGGHISK